MYYFTIPNPFKLGIPLRYRYWLWFDFRHLPSVRLSEPNSAESGTNTLDTSNIPKAFQEDPVAVLKEQRRVGAALSQRAEREARLRRVCSLLSLRLFPPSFLFFPWFLNFK